MKDLYDNGCTIFTPSYPNPEFAARQTLFASGSTAGQSFQQGAVDDAGKGDEWGFIPYPGPDGTLVVNSLGQMVGIVRTNPEQDMASWLFLRYLTSPETQTTWISYTGYFPSQITTDVAEREASDPVWATGYGLLDLGKAEPNLAAHGAARSAIRDAFFDILEAEDLDAIIAILEELNTLLAELVAELQ